ncbi:MAG: twin-arginine translocase subunit TatC [Nanohaloarchaea archaeon]|nr:twin-arginine translocase subunit TatC [Candidatus Nanohaloarchaea archaeon]
MQQLEDHVIELRRRLIRISISLVIATALSFYFSPDILIWLQNDLSVEVHALKAFETFYTELMIALILGFFISLPYTIYQIIKFMKPGLKEREYKVMRNYLPFSIILFLGGAVFAYEFVIKASFAFFEGVGQSAGVTSVWGLKNTLGFAMKISGFTGVFFQLPIVSVVLARAGILESEMMVKYRNYFIVAVLLFSAMATPPDLITQILITLPVIGLYQVSIFLVGKIQN